MMNKTAVKLSITQLNIQGLSKKQAQQIKGGSDQTTDDIVIVDVITT